MAINAIEHLLSLYRESYSHLPTPNRLCINIHSGLDNASILDIETVDKSISDFLGKNITTVIGLTVTNDINDSIGISALFCDF